MNQNSLLLSKISHFFQQQENKQINNKNGLEAGLYVVSTPIGNLEDITLRALKTLLNANLIICEDSRVSLKLLNAFNLNDQNKKPIIYNDHSNEKVRHFILGQIQAGQSLALISDAGTPIISDPGYKLLQFLAQSKVKIVPIPGCCALITAISVCQIAGDNFLFLGFLPDGRQAALNFLHPFQFADYSLAFFEAPHRLIERLQIFQEIFSQQKIAIIRELTKIHEEVLVDYACNLLQFFEQNPEKIRGEIVIIIEKYPKKNWQKNLKEEQKLVIFFSNKKISK